MQLQQSQNIAAQEYIQNLQLIQQSNVSTTHIPTPPSASSVSSITTQSHNPLLGSLLQTSSDHSTDDVEMQNSNQGSPFSLKDNTLGTRNRRTLSGSGSTISQTTRDRLKTMIASKKQKQKVYGTSSTGSNSGSNVSLAAVPGSSWSQFIEPNSSSLIRNTLKENVGRQVFFIIFLLLFYFLVYCFNASF